MCSAATSASNAPSTRMSIDPEFHAHVPARISASSRLSASPMISREEGRVLKPVLLVFIRGLFEAVRHRGLTRDGARGATAGRLRLPKDVEPPAWGRGRVARRDFPGELPRLVEHLCDDLVVFGLGILSKDVRARAQDDEVRIEAVHDVDPVRSAIKPAQIALDQRVPEREDDPLLAPAVAKDHRVHKRRRGLTHRRVTNQHEPLPSAEDVAERPGVPR